MRAGKFIFKKLLEIGKTNRYAILARHNHKKHGSLGLTRLRGWLRCHRPLNLNWVMPAEELSYTT
ncbi:hypothetical protein ADS79_12505 [Brevibacillus reuszeri]|uniref:Uncharacterized protein n=1 Tax=Brevibacillus reuszeri TaxID=54915 RepID=A0A0K9YVB9_9BACL|nr:hypothetical protein ADS79_12505 [Brevibacillus reuszeri]